MVAQVGYSVAGQSREVCEWFGLKTTRTVFVGLASKPVVTVFSVLASKPAATVS
jgi:hypothetical protein